MIVNKIILYVLFGFTLLVGFGSYVSADIQPWSMPTDRVCEVIECPQLNVDIKDEFWAIGQCESGHNLKAKNKNSSASGEYQFIKGSWKHYGLELWGDDFYDKDVFSEDNKELARYVYDKYGNKPWLESRPCWSKMKILSSSQ